MTRVPGTLKDRGHYARKACAWSVALLTFPLYALFRGAGATAEWWESRVERLWVWAKPCLYYKAPRDGD